MCDPLFDPFCEPEPEVVEDKNKMDDGHMSDGNHDDMDSMDDMTDMLTPLQGQLVYLIVSGIAASKAGLDLFRYKSDDYYDAAGKDKWDWNPWKIANLTEQYTSLVLWGVLFIFQLLSTFGVLTHINLMMWFWAGVIGGVVYMVTAIFRLMAYEGAWSEAAYANASTIRSDSVYMTATESAFAVPLILEYANWMYAQYLGLPEDKKEMWKESKDDDKMFSL